MGNSISIIKEIIVNRKLMMNLAKNDFKTKFAGSYFGIFWAFVQPIVTVLVYWFVFQVGFGAQPVNGCPYVLWLTAGLVPWFYFQDLLNGGVNAFLEYNYLVKKVVFQISILPCVKVISALFVHLFFVLVTIVIYLVYGVKFDLYTLQIIYYSFSLTVFGLALSYFNSSIVIFFKDLSQLIMILLQVGVWITPIMWQLDILPEKWQTVMKLNPIFYIVRGYRQALYDKEWFWTYWQNTIYFWVVTIVLFIIGTKVFSKLKVHFSDVL